MRARVCSSPRPTILVWSILGGSFGLSYYETSNKIVDPKAGAIRKTGAEAVVTTCPGCCMQIIDSLRRQGLPRQFCTSSTCSNLTIPNIKGNLTETLHKYSNGQGLSFLRSLSSRKRGGIQ